jgi:hypothetical protein
MAKDWMGSGAASKPSERGAWYRTAIGKPPTCLWGALGTFLLQPARSIAKGARPCLFNLAHLAGWGT